MVELGGRVEHEVIFNAFVGAEEKMKKFQTCPGIFLHCTPALLLLLLLLLHALPSSVQLRHKPEPPPSPPPHQT